MTFNYSDYLTAKYQADFMSNPGETGAVSVDSDGKISITVLKIPNINLKTNDVFDGCPKIGSEFSYGAFFLFCVVLPVMMVVGYFLQ